MEETQNTEFMLYVFIALIVLLGIIIFARFRGGGGRRDPFTGHGSEPIDCTKSKTWKNDEEVPRTMVVHVDNNCQEGRKANLRIFGADGNEETDGPFRKVPYQPKYPSGNRWPGYVYVVTVPSQGTIRVECRGEVTGGGCLFSIQPLTRPANYPYNTNSEGYGAAREIPCGRTVEFFENTTDNPVHIKIIFSQHCPGSTPSISITGQSDPIVAGGDPPLETPVHAVPPGGKVTINCNGSGNRACKVHGNFTVPQ